MQKPEITLIPLSDALEPEFLALEVREDQRSFIETPAEALADRNSRGWDVDWTIHCLYWENHMVGYTMHGMNRWADAWMDRFMIDRRFQGRGFASAALPKILAEIRARYPGRRRILLSVEPENAPAIRLYQRFGFRMTDEWDCAEQVMELREG